MSPAQQMAPKKDTTSSTEPAAATEPSATVTKDTKDPSATPKKRGWFHIPFTKG
jgi:hypothetical protein